MKNRFVFVLALVLLAFASVSMAVENLPQNEVDEIIKGVESGDADAQCRLGIMLLTGQNFKEDDEQAVYWLKKSYEQGNVEAQFFLAILCHNGKGVEKDEAQAFKLMKSIAEKDPGSIKSVLGPEIKGQKMYSSAEELVAAAQFFLGDAYYQGGGGVQKDLGQAEYWLDKAAEKGNERIKKDAQSQLAFIRAETAKKAQTPTAPVQPQPRAEQPKSESVIEVGIEQLLQDYEGNKIAARRKYDGKKIRLSGVISEVDEDSNKKFYVRLQETLNEFSPRVGGIECYFDSQSDSVMNLKVRQNVIIEGTCVSYETWGHGFMPELKNCHIVNAGTKSESVMEIDLAQAFKECRDNGLVYKRKYDGKRVRVSEKIFYIGTNPFDNRIYVRLSYWTIVNIVDTN